MLKILYNEESNADHVVHLTIRGNYCKAECTSAIDGLKGIDAIESMRPYSSYTLTESNGTIKSFRRPMQSDYRWLDLNRLGVSVKLDFGILTQLYGNHTILSVDTGVIADGERDIIVRLFNGKKENLTVEADQEFELVPFSSEALILGDHPRMKLWDSYALQSNDRELMANRKGFLVAGDSGDPLCQKKAMTTLTLPFKSTRETFRPEKS